MKKIHKDSSSLLIPVSDTEQVDYCGVRAFMEIMGGKWKFLIYCHLLSKPMRYKHLLEAMPQASEKMIFSSLRELEANKIVERFIYPEIPQRVEYGITDYGKELEPILKTIELWGKAHIHAYPETVYFDPKP